MAQGCLGKTVEKELKSKPKNPPWVPRSMDYWHVLIDNIAEKSVQVRKRVKDRLEARQIPDMTMKWLEIAEWGGFTLLESRSQLQIAYRRAVVFFGAYPYGTDLYVTWDSWINLGKWLRSYVRTDVESCSIFANDVKVYDWVEAYNDPTEYDYADVRSLGQAVHASVVEVVSAIRDELKIEKAIDFTIHEGGRLEGGSPGKPGSAKDKKVF